MNITQLVVAIIDILVGVIVLYLIPYIKGKVTADKLQKAVFWAKLAVEAAEKIFKESGMGKAKKEYVMEFLNSKGLKLDEKELDIVIESAVLEMQTAINA